MVTLNIFGNQLWADEKYRQTNISLTTGLLLHYDKYHVVNVFISVLLPKKIKINNFSDVLLLVNKHHVANLFTSVSLQKK